MYENRTKYPKKKTQMQQQLLESPKKYNVIALVRMEKVRASQLLPLRKKLQGEVDAAAAVIAGEDPRAVEYNSEAEPEAEVDTESQSEE